MKTKERCKTCGERGYISKVYLIDWPVCDECTISFLEELKSLVENPDITEPQLMVWVYPQNKTGDNPIDDEKK
tara:strand:+ start:860 stop:1078 length:219 start_codon:yes stop_codon:yes gene_type:complete